MSSTGVHRFGNGEKFYITLDDDFVEIEVDDPAEEFTVGINCADAIALAHAILRRYPDGIEVLVDLTHSCCTTLVGEGTENPRRSAHRGGAIDLELTRVPAEKAIGNAGWVSTIVSTSPTGRSPPSPGGCAPSTLGRHVGPGPLPRFKPTEGRRPVATVTFTI